MGNWFSTRDDSIESKPTVIVSNMEDAEIVYTGAKNYQYYFGTRPIIQIHHKCDPIPE